MGLDITFYRGMKRVEEATWNLAVSKAEYPEEVADVAYNNGWASLHINPDFPGRAEGIDGDVAYEYEDSDSFRAGSYGGYNRWREQLARMVCIDYEAFCQRYIGGLPFAPLIWFSDCEGTIGPVVSRRLALDFERHLVLVEELDADPYFLSSYREWMTAFQAAADRGCVAFH